MLTFKKKYYFIIEDIKDINLENIKKNNKLSLIYRNKKKLKERSFLVKFRKKCRLKCIKFYIANDIHLAVYLKADGVYLSAWNKTFKALNYKKNNFNIIGSAHNLNEVSLKFKQGCNSILYSKLFLVDYNKTSPFLGIIKFNNLILKHKNLIPFGGINLSNINKLNNVKCEGFALMSEIKKKPAIIRRLF